MGPFVDVGDGFTPQTDIGNPDTNLTGVDEAELLKHNGAATVDITTRTWAAVAGCDGWYDLTLTTDDTNAEGLLDIVIQDDSDCLPVHKQFMVLSQAAYDSKYVAKDAGFMDVNIKTIGRADADETAVDNLELQYDTTGLIGDTFPLRQDQGASISGGLAVRANMVSPVTVIAGSEQNIANTTASNGFYWTGDDDGAGAEFIFLCTPADTTAEPGDLHFEGYYDEPGAPKTNGASVYVYNFQTATWVLHITLTDAAADEIHDVSLTHADGAPGSGTLEGRAFVLGDVLIKFKQDSPEGGNACLLIDRMYVGFISAPITATEIVDEWETQSQADPTGFYVNVREWLDIAVTLSTNNKPDVNVNEWKDVVVTTAVPDAATTAAGLHATTNALISAAAIRAAVGLASANLDTQLGTLSTHDAAAVKTAIEAGGSSLAQILEDTGELQTDNIPGTLSMIAGYLDTEIAAIKAVTDVIPDAGALTTIGTDTARLTTERAAVLTDWINGERLDTILDAVSGGGTTNLTTETTTVESED